VVEAVAVVEVVAAEAEAAAEVAVTAAEAALVSEVAVLVVVGERALPPCPEVARDT